MARRSSARDRPERRQLRHPRLCRAGQTARFESLNAPDSETTLDGNSVVVEEQMLKMAESRMAYDAAIGFYQKSMQMIRMAAKKPGV